MNEKKDKKILKGFLMGVAVTLLTLAAIFVLYMYLPLGYTASSPTGLSTYKKLREAMAAINGYYSGEVDEQTLTDYMFLGLAAGLNDPYSTYYTAEEYESVSNTQQGHYKGIGVTIAVRTEDGGIEIMDVTADGPADAAGIRTGELLRSVNGESVEGFGSSEVSAMIQSAESDDIVLGIYNEETGEEREVTVTRELLDSVSVSGELLDGGAAYIAISSFTGLTAEQFSQKWDELGGEAECLVVDLRGNQGGLVSAAKDLLKQFVPDGLLFYTQDKNGSREDVTVEGGESIDVPVAVLVDENTASASEIVAGCLQDKGAAIIVGQQTYGKGIIQDVFKLGDGSVLKLTISHYYTPNGNDIHGVGITPDIEVGEADEDDGEDAVLQAALEALK